MFFVTSRRPTCPTSPKLPATVCPGSLRRLQPRKLAAPYRTSTWSRGTMIHVDDG